MNTDAAVTRPWLDRIGGYGLYVGLFALPVATSSLLILRLFNTFSSIGLSNTFPTLIVLAAFIALPLLIEPALGRRFPSLSSTGGRTCFDPALTAGEKLRALRADPDFTSYLAAQLFVVCALSLALILFR